MGLSIWNYDDVYRCSRLVCRGGNKRAGMGNRKALSTKQDEGAGGLFIKVYMLPLSFSNF